MTAPSSWPPCLPGAGEHLAHALPTDGHFLGEPAAVWACLADDHGGAQPASRLMELLARRLPRRGTTRPLGAATGTATALWRAALDANLPPGALADAGHFAAALPDAVWLPLARRSAAHTPAQARADKVAERAAAHPREPDALLLAAHLLTRPAPEDAADVRRHARTLLQAAEALPAPDRPAEAEQLRRALVEAGEVDLAPTPAPTD
ncbi:hypothetical protein POF50_008420 [Streptomyces sp. SL13]|uniref:Uncharacterized protein n=1 Tax=Streptantibioticus silvisoli TaxID=2705255 RepID=A0AA90H2B2_9ACTN|nr:hypothetical protein [Streptantibioticus silvisoli]MDI5969370.1 hypothetical protein [Streptantibioticus silvisoli]